jgi:hypothetical protein
MLERKTVTSWSEPVTSLGSLIQEQDDFVITNDSDTSLDRLSYARLKATIINNNPGPIGAIKIIGVCNMQTQEYTITISLVPFKSEHEHALQQTLARGGLRTTGGGFYNIGGRYQDTHHLNLLRTAGISTAGTLQLNGMEEYSQSSVIDIVDRLGSLENGISERARYIAAYIVRGVTPEFLLRLAHPADVSAPLRSSHSSEKGVSPRFPVP